MTSQKFPQDPGPELQMLRVGAVRHVVGDSVSTIYRSIAAGTFPRAISLGPNRKAWPRYEIEAVNRARLAGKAVEDIRGIVADLEAARKALSTKHSSEIRAFVARLLA